MGIRFAVDAFRSELRLSYWIERSRSEFSMTPIRVTRTRIQNASIEKACKASRFALQTMNLVVFYWHGLGLTRKFNVVEI